ncbi:MAG: hypothetical protein E5X33_28520 [Mesorhizobium sp.]|uniref:hypothetical protein n=1 Tax=Mesorhizobium sp. TaxID=1871066 RepID=UPI000FE822D0|nr:hypothetical protein [Mesorhizobium sp.]RWI94683.1 MAG: hypothetical protein EOR22_11555 [Mesorhizobium sp.]TIR16575.1 MAG: hypothetical protein E5X33_28520 [Mesorhizobium sp.]
MTKPKAVTDSGDVQAAAQWLATGGADRTKAAVPQLRQQFGLTAAEAVAAIRESNLIQARAH